MPEEEVVRRAEHDREEGKSPSTQAGEFVREEMEHIREGKHGARSPKQAIAIGLSKARRAGVPLPVPARGKTSERTRRQAERELKRGRGSSGRVHGPGRKPNPRRSRATSRALRHEGRSAASPRALRRQTHFAAQRRGSSSRHAAAMKAVRTKGHRRMSEAARKAARTRAKHRKAA